MKRVHIRIRSVIPPWEIYKYTYTLCSHEKYESEKRSRSEESEAVLYRGSQITSLSLSPLLLLLLRWYTIDPKFFTSHREKRIYDGNRNQRHADAKQNLIKIMFTTLAE